MNGRYSKIDVNRISSLSKDRLQSLLPGTDDVIPPGGAADPDGLRGVGVDEPRGDEQRAAAADPVRAAAGRRLPAAGRRVPAAGRQQERLREFLYSNNNIINRFRSYTYIFLQKSVLVKHAQ